MKRIPDLFIIFDLIWTIFSFLYEPLEHKIHLQLHTDSVTLYFCFVLTEGASFLEAFRSSCLQVVPDEETPNEGCPQLKSLNRKIRLS